MLVAILTIFLSLSFFGLTFPNFFHGAHHFVLERLTNISAFFVTYNEQDDSHIYRKWLFEHVVTSALHDAGHTPLPPRCYPGTRVKVQAEMMNWVADETLSKFLWLTGPAGVGKTAIVGTIADDYKEEGGLAASFFFSAFSGGPYRQSKARFISTLAYQVLIHLPEIDKKMVAAIKGDPAVFDKRLDEQFKTLILEPIRETMEMGCSDPSDWRRILLVDGLDECTAEQDPSASPRELRRRTEATHQEILTILYSAVENPSFPFRIILASRPEEAICQFFLTQTQHTELFLDEKYAPSDDIKHFLEARLREIQKRYDLPDNWVPQSAIQLLVDRASGQFIYAVVAIRFIEDGDELPQQQMQMLLRWSPEPSRPPDSNPFAALDELYTRILMTSPKPDLAVKWILAINRFRKEGPYTPEAIKDYLESAAGETRFLLGRLNSVIHVSTERNSDLPLFHLHHQSLLDFLGDPSRCGQLYVDKEKVEGFLRERWAKILEGRGPHRCFGRDAAIHPDFLDLYLDLSMYQPQVVSHEERKWLNAMAGTVILLLGKTGVGKSHFINVAAGRAIATVGNSLASSSVKTCSFVLDNPTLPTDASITSPKVVLVDAPGFDNTYVSDSEILRETAKFLGELERRRPGAQLGGVIYFQDITEDRLIRPPVRHFSDPELCCRFLVVSTKWDIFLASSVGIPEEREGRLANAVWREALRKGARMAERYDNTTSSARAILSQLLGSQPFAIEVLQKVLARMVVQLQKHELSYRKTKVALKRFVGFFSFRKYVK